MVDFYQNNWFKASPFSEKLKSDYSLPFEGDIKVRLFITSILFFLGRGCSQTVNCQLSTVNCLIKSSSFQVEFTVNCSP
ncbi:hypothetical protein [Microcoleus sp. CAWBG24]|uniref:hypothetical protein n=1 Tax=Microcoleus sp. CAWBG24 TaxID=2841644 RepID=UPI0025D711A8|nr:hypothetical protein [Microcoleus sp. CAWBG24]